MPLPVGYGTHHEMEQNLYFYSQFIDWKMRPSSQKCYLPKALEVFAGGIMADTNFLMPVFLIILNRPLY